MTIRTSLFYILFLFCFDNLKNGERNVLHSNKRGMCISISPYNLYLRMSPLYRVDGCLKLLDCERALV